MTQEYEKYTQEDHQVWGILYGRQMKVLPQSASREFLEGLDRVEFKEERVPDFRRVNPLLQKLTGWELFVVPGIVDNKTFFELMANRQFPATTWLRKMSELDYLEEPDMFHDVFGHVPLLSNQAFVDFLQSLSLMALEHIDNEEAIELLSRIYWYTVEFGLIREQGEIRIYGAGILSSNGESRYCISDEPEHREFDVEQIYDTPYIKEKFQEVYYIAESYEQLYQAMPAIREGLEKRIRIKT